MTDDDGDWLDVDGVTEPDDPVDAFRVVSDDRSSARIDTALLRATQVYDDEDRQFSLTVHLDGPDIALKAGTEYVPPEDDADQLYTWHGLSVKKARALAAALDEAADQAEARQQELAERDRQGGDQDDDSGFLRRLMER